MLDPMIHIFSKFIKSFGYTFGIGAVLLVIVNVMLGNSFVVDATAANKLENTIYLELKDGVVIIELLPDIAPEHVKRIKELCVKKFYDKIVFHRVIDGFMAQTGDPTGTGTGGSGKNLKAEFSNLHHKRGSVSMARAMDPDSADSQFFIVLDDAPHLDGQYTLFGHVTSGMEFVDKIKKGDRGNNGMVQNPDKIITMRVAIDAEKERVTNIPK